MTLVAEYQFWVFKIRLKVGLKEILKVLEMKEFGDAKNWAHFYKIEIKVI